MSGRASPHSTARDSSLAGRPVGIAVLARNRAAFGTNAQMLVREDADGETVSEREDLSSLHHAIREDPRDFHQYASHRHSLNHHDHDVPYDAYVEGRDYGGCCGALCGERGLFTNKCAQVCGYLFACLLVGSLILALVEVVLLNAQVNNLTERVNKLDKSITSVRDFAHHIDEVSAPTSQVSYFDAVSCPDGWDLYPDLIGKAIIGKNASAIQSFHLSPETTNPTANPEFFPLLPCKRHRTHR